MSDTIKYIGIYIFGAATGAAIATVMTKKKCTKQYDEAVKSVKEYYKTKEKTEYEKPTLDVHNFGEPDREISVDNTLKDELEALAAKYKNKPIYEDIPSFVTPEQTSVSYSPYVIDETDFGEYEDYEQINLTYYSDGQLTDSDDEIVENEEEVVGNSWRERFDKYDEIVVYVRNDSRKCDYEIAKDMRTYADVLEDRPYLLHNVFDRVITSVDEDE